jgi:hypothetical protein
MSRADKEQRALAVADMLNLTKALDSYVGSELLKGIRQVPRGVRGGGEAVLWSSALAGC